MKKKEIIKVGLYSDHEEILIFNLDKENNCIGAKEYFENTDRDIDDYDFQFGKLPLKINSKVKYKFDAPSKDWNYD